MVLWATPSREEPGKDTAVCWGELPSGRRVVGRGRDQPSLLKPSFKLQA